VAHWITFKEEQRLDWQQKYLTQLCEADQEIQEAYELVTDFTSMLRERQGERLDAWLQEVEAQGIAELKNFAEAVKTRLRCGESWPHSGVEQWPDRGPGASLETLKETNVWPRPLRSPTETSSQASLEKALEASTSLIHQKFGRPLMVYTYWLYRLADHSACLDTQKGVIECILRTYSCNVVAYLIYRRDRWCNSILVSSSMCLSKIS